MQNAKLTNDVGNPRERVLNFAWWLGDLNFEV
jgi:hypothetical protein